MKNNTSMTAEIDYEGTPEKELIEHFGDIEL